MTNLEDSLGSKGGLQPTAFQGFKPKAREKIGPLVLQSKETKSSQPLSEFRSLYFPSQASKRP